ncbi:MAG: adenylyltransferase/cytidyltransferase family protein [Bacteroidales bacterium]
MLHNKTVVYVGGTFDMFHSNHLRMIEYARGLADILIIGVSTDKLVATYKKPPIIPFEERIEIIKALQAPDIVVPQHSLNHTELVKNLNVDAFVIGSDWKGKYDYLQDLGVQVFYFPYGVGITSSNLKQKILSQYQEFKDYADKHDNPDVT